MSSYNYNCASCGSEFEVKKHFSEASRGESCPQCGSPAIRRYTSIPALFGWRLTDESNFVKGTPDKLERNV